MSFLLEDGFSTIITFPGAGVSFLEKTATPPGLDMGDKIDVTTMRNFEWRTFASRSLATVTDMTVTVAYDPLLAFNTFNTELGRNQEVVIVFPDGTTYSFWGFAKSFVPNENQEGQQPTAVLMMVCTNVNPNTGLEEGPEAA